MYWIDAVSAPGGAARQVARWRICCGTGRRPGKGCLKEIPVCRGDAKRAFLTATTSRALEPAVRPSSRQCRGVGMIFTGWGWR